MSLLKSLESSLIASCRIVSLLYILNGGKIAIVKIKSSLNTPKAECAYFYCLMDWISRQSHFTFSFTRPSSVYRYIQVEVGVIGCSVLGKEI
jgi:hypothetical protein